MAQPRGYWEKRLRDAEREVVDAAVSLDDLWKELGSCETTGERVSAPFERFLDALDAVRVERERLL